MPARHGFVEHTGEVKLHVEAPSLAELLAEAGRALAHLLAGALPRASPADPVIVVDVSAPDVDALVAEWLNELIFRAEVEKRALVPLEVRATSPTSVSARLAGPPLEEVVTAVKAATLHGLHVEEHDGRWSADVILDV